MILDGDRLSAYLATAGSSHHCCCSGAFRQAASGVFATTRMTWLGRSIAGAHSLAESID